MADNNYFWPVGLPQAPFRTDYKRGTANNTVRNKMELGPAKTRRRSTANVANRAMTFMLKERHQCPSNPEPIDQKALFLSFYEVVDCNTPFWLPDPEDITRYMLVKIKAADEDGGPELSVLAHRVWQVTLQLEVFPYAERPRT